jgi:hypothetical protein
MLKLTRFKISYSSPTGRSNENICNSSGGAQEKGKDRIKPNLPPKVMVFSLSTPLNANVLFCNLTCVRPNSGFLCCVFLTLRITLLTQLGFIHNWVIITVDGGLVGAGSMWPSETRIEWKSFLSTNHPSFMVSWWLLVHSCPAHTKEYSVQCTPSFLPWLWHKMPMYTFSNDDTCKLKITLHGWWQRHSTRHYSFLLARKFCPSTLCFFILNPLFSPCLFKPISRITYLLKK